VGRVESVFGAARAHVTAVEEQHRSERIDETHRET
jgi:hypothetical protein